jgi:hypothetical protein
MKRSDGNMTVREYADKKVQELREKGNKNVCVKKVEACKVGKNCYSIELFNTGTVSPEAEITDVLPEGRFEMTKGVVVTISFIPPRCRKEKREYFHAALA